MLCTPCQIYGRKVIYLLMNFNFYYHIFILIWFYFQALPDLVGSQTHVFLNQCVQREQVIFVSYLPQVIELSQRVSVIFASLSLQARSLEQDSVPPHLYWSPQILARGKKIFLLLAIIRLANIYWVSVMSQAGFGTEKTAANKENKMPSLPEQLSEKKGIQMGTGSPGVDWHTICS